GPPLANCCSPTLLPSLPSSPQHLPPLPTRRSSDLSTASTRSPAKREMNIRRHPSDPTRSLVADGWTTMVQTSVPKLLVGSDGCRDRKSTRLNSSHVKISYAVFCLKKKKKKTMYCNA